MSKFRSPPQPDQSGSEEQDSQQQGTEYPQQPQYPPQFLQPPQYPYPQPQYTPPPMAQTPPPKKKSRKKLWLIIGAAIIVLIIAASISAQLSPSSTGTTPQATVQATQVVQPTQPPAKPTVVPTQAPTVSPAQLEAIYKAITTNTTVVNLDKEGATDKGKDVHFTSTIVAFVKDSSGNTAGANVTDPNNSGSFIQVIFPASTDLSQLNTGDTLEVWGTDEGVFSGTNGFGATIQEVGIAAQYMTDQTTNYQTNM